MEMDSTRLCNKIKRLVLPQVQLDEDQREEEAKFNFLRTSLHHPFSFPKW